MTHFVPLNIYGVEISHPLNWRLFINPNSTFNFNEGFIKVDKVTTSKKNASSLSVRWATMKSDVNLEEYVEELEKEFKRKEKRSKKKDRYRMADKQYFFMNGRDAYFLQNEFIANHSIYRIFGQDELVKVYQVIFYSSESQRIIVASLSSTEEEMQKNEELFKDILFSVRESLSYTENDLEGKTQLA